MMALLDFEWARFGDHVDDWVFLARFSGLHAAAWYSLASAATRSPR
ncbi:hypothetical protein [Saccharopolyspora phatthalungensis]|uniref:Aminoglycoside phosphotransferase domain-containing protein n=1 Tax=Saccharopolyspora phatthalungensis TaxID=664693 RepID=A0A840QI90_9PSEU|nr:hypothetical protein [Saccharopolyspora phatthalungensis]MBB5157073.1 hypothetical protein [Saccharopolyspora phatthalungensis]